MSEKKRTRQRSISFFLIHTGGVDEATTSLSSLGKEQLQLFALAVSGFLLYKVSLLVSAVAPDEQQK